MYPYVRVSLCAATTSRTCCISIRNLQLTCAFYMIIFDLWRTSHAFRFRFGLIRILWCVESGVQCALVAQAPSAAPRIGGAPASRPTSAAQARKVPRLHIVASVHLTCSPLSTSALLLLITRAQDEELRRRQQKLLDRQKVYLMKMHMDFGIDMVNKRLRSQSDSYWPMLCKWALYECTSRYVR